MVYKLTNYLSSLWNWLDLLCLIFYTLGTIFLECFANKDSHTLEEWGRIAVVLSLVCFYLRLLNMFAVSRALGPKIKIIWQMWRDLRVIVAILVVLIVAFAVSFRALVASRNGPEFSFYELRDIVAKSWWPLFGEFSKDSIETLKQNCTGNASNAHSNGSNTIAEYCPMTLSAATALILQGLFVMFTSLLLFNLLIAMFKYAVLTM